MKDLTLEQRLALFLYSLKRDSNYAIKAHSMTLTFNTGHPETARLNDIANDFSRYVNKDPELGECFDTAREVLGEVR